jgi:hypothetical protein
LLKVVAIRGRNGGITLAICLNDSLNTGGASLDHCLTMLATNGQSMFAKPKPIT